MHFRIDVDNNIVALPEGVPSDNTLPIFSTEAQLFQALSDRDPVEVWNSFAGTPGFSELKPVKKFENRKIGVARIWKAIQRLADAPAARRAAVPERKAAKEPVAAKPERAPKEKKPRVVTPKSDGAESKGDIVRRMISEKGGASLPEIMEATKWQAHSVRGFISTLQSKHGMKITSRREVIGGESIRVYEGA